MSSKETWWETENVPKIMKKIGDFCKTLVDVSCMSK